MEFPQWDSTFYRLEPCLIGRALFSPLEKFLKHTITRWNLFLTQCPVFSYNYAQDLEKCEWDVVMMSSHLLAPISIANACRREERVENKPAGSLGVLTTKQVS